MQAHKLLATHLRGDSSESPMVQTRGVPKSRGWKYLVHHRDVSSMRPEAIVHRDEGQAPPGQRDSK